LTTKHNSLHAIINELVERTNSDTQRIRALEQRTESAMSRMDSIEQELMKMTQSLQKISSDMEAKFKSNEAVDSETQNTIKEIINRVKKLAPAEKVEELEALLEIYNPLKSNFVTMEEVENIIAERLSRLKNNK
jgi:predicted phage gp36 major capsid-like protein